MALLYYILGSLLFSFTKAASLDDTDPAAGSGNRGGYTGSPGLQYKYAHCQLRPDKAPITGSVDFREQASGSGNLEVRLNVTGLDPWDTQRLHGIHVHTYGDLSEGCMSAGGHFNPFNTPHGAPSNNPWKRHVGDFGNVEEDGSPNIRVQFQDYLASLTGPNSILGRAFVIHEKVDDLGRGGEETSLTNGNAGVRLACCVIGITDDRHWH